MVDKSTQSTVSKIAGTVIAIAAGWAAQKVIATAWKAASGHKLPKADDDTDAGLAEVAAAAAIMGAVAALVRVLVTRGTVRALH